MAKAIELARRDSRSDARGYKVEHLAGEFPGDAHALDILGSFQMDRHASNKKSAKDKSSVQAGQTVAFKGSPPAAVGLE
jgi:hypothetical protein